MNRLGNAGCRRRINHHIIQIAINQILHSQGTILICLCGCLEPFKSPVLVTFALKLPGGEVLHANVYFMILFLQNLLHICRFLALIKLCAVRFHYQALRRIVVRI